VNRAVPRARRPTPPPPTGPRHQNGAPTPPGPPRARARSMPLSVTLEEVWQARAARGRPIPVERHGLCDRCRAGKLRAADVERLVAETLDLALRGDGKRCADGREDA
jgi:hypothetical protein